MPDNTVHAHTPAYKPDRPGRSRGTLYEHEVSPDHPQNANHLHRKEREERAARGSVFAINEWLALRVTLVVGSMWCAYFFAALALSGFPGTHATGTQYVQWFSQTFLQLVLLSVIMVGQSVMGRHGEHLAEAMYKNVLRLLHELVQIGKHLSAQDDELLAHREHYEALADHLKRQDEELHAQREEVLRLVALLEGVYAHDKAGRGQ